MSVSGDTFEVKFWQRLPLLEAALASRPDLLAWLHDCVSWPNLLELSDLARRGGVQTASGLDLKFVPAPARRRRRGASRPPLGPSYEQRIYEHGEIQTRSHNWHDFFNALAWILFPQVKAALNARQVLAARPGVVRTREQDRLAMMDEGGVLIIDGRVLIVGHALMESMVQGVRDIRAMAFTINAELHQADSVAALAISEGVFETPRTFPLYDLDRGVIHDGGNVFSLQSMCLSDQVTE